MSDSAVPSLVANLIAYRRWKELAAVLEHVHDLREESVLDILRVLTSGEVHDELEQVIVGW